MWLKDDNQKKTPGSGFWSRRLAQVHFTAEDDWDFVHIGDFKRVTLNGLSESSGSGQ